MTEWTIIENKAKAYEVATGYDKEEIFEEIYWELTNYIDTCAKNAVRKAGGYMLNIPEEDFVSEFNLQLWQAIKNFDSEKGKFQGLLNNRFRRNAEPNVYRKYQYSDATEKDGKSYGKARWDSTDREIGSDDGSSSTLGDVVMETVNSAESTFMDQYEINEILQAYTKVNERYSKIIVKMFEGYTGDDLAQAVNEDCYYSSKVRKVVQRAKNSFEEFLKEYIK